MADRDQIITIIIWILIFVLCVALPGTIGFLGSTLSYPCWTSLFIQPSWTPPAWLFPIAWSLFYLCMGVSSFVIIFYYVKRGGRNDEHYSRKVITALMLYVLQLCLVGVWPAIFNTYEQFVGAAVEMAFLWAVIALCLFAFWLVTPIASILMVPYFIWISYAFSVNVGVAVLNPNGPPKCP